MSKTREQRESELKAMTEEDLLAAYSEVFGIGVAPAQPERAIESILAKEFGSSKKVQFKAFCSLCADRTPHKTPGVTRTEDGEKVQVMECMICNTWNKVPTGEDGEQFQENMDTPDHTDFSAINDLTKPSPPTKKLMPIKCACGASPVLYWLKNEVWFQIETPPGTETGRCPDCAESILGRKLTLDDLDIANYNRTKKMSQEFRREYARSTIYGACQAVGVPVPTGWQCHTEPPYNDGIEVGERLAKQTPNPQRRLVELFRDFDKVFG